MKPERVPSRGRTIAGYFLLVIGAIACPFPIIPGIPIIAAGVALLGTDHRVVRAGRAWLERLRPFRRKEKPQPEEG